ncbi:MAG: SPOR domain-containing protein [Gammaproteobacteria bacterium]|nr:SPOR domain-containing protein [Gammaproteobacteria bacterium]
MAAKSADKKSSASSKPKGATSRKSKGKSTSAWMWMLTGLATGLFVAFLVFLDNRSPSPEETVAADASVEKPASTANNTSANKKPDAAASDSTDLQFYKILPELQVKVPQNSTTQAPGQADIPPQTTKSPGAATSKGVYFLQAGSFRNYADADGRKASLALLGVESQIQKSIGSKGDTWYRVRIGPDKDPERLQDLRSLLHKNMIETLLVKLEE